MVIQQRFDRTEKKMGRAHLRELKGGVLQISAGHEKLRSRDSKPGGQEDIGRKMSDSGEIWGCDSSEKKGKESHRRPDWGKNA